MLLVTWLNGINDDMHIYIYKVVGNQRLTFKYTFNLFFYIWYAYKFQDKQKLVIISVLEN